MKLNKIFIIALTALTVTACSNDDEPALNTEQGVTVSLDNSFTYPDRNPQTSDTLYVNENVGIFNLPIIVSGKSNGDIIVNIDVVAGQGNSATDLDPAKEVKDYVVTSRTIRIPAGESVGHVEINAIWPQGVIDNNRTFTVRITDVKGASIGNNETVITIINIDSVYTMMLGNWTFSGLDYDGAPVQLSIIVDAPAPDDPAYGSELYAIGMLGYEFVYCPFTFEYDKETEKVNMTIPTNRVACTGNVNFGAYVGVFVTASSISPLWGNDIQLTVSDDFREITADPNDVLYYMVINNSTGSVAGIFDKYSNMKFTKN